MCILYTLLLALVVLVVQSDLLLWLQLFGRMLMTVKINSLTVFTQNQGSEGGYVSNWVPPKYGTYTVVVIDTASGLTSSGTFTVNPTNVSSGGTTMLTTVPTTISIVSSGSTSSVGGIPLTYVVIIVIAIVIIVILVRKKGTV